MKLKDNLKGLRLKQISELSQELSKNRVKLAEMKRDLSLDKLKKNSEISKIKRQIARIQTIMREKIAAEISQEEKNSQGEKNA